MVLYSIIMFIAAIPMIQISIAIYQGKTSLIHDYHQTKVTDKAAYGKSFGKGMFVISIALLLSGILALFTDSQSNSMIPIIVLFIGLFFGIVWIIVVQLKYNKGIF